MSGVSGQANEKWGCRSIPIPITADIVRPEARAIYVMAMADPRLLILTPAGLGGIWDW